MISNNPRGIFMNPNTGSMVVLLTFVIVLSAILSAVFHIQTTKILKYLQTEAFLFIKSEIISAIVSMNAILKIL